MKDFVRPAGRLRALPLPARLVYTIFCAFSVMALAESAWLGADMVSADLSGVETYYAGGSEPPPNAAAEQDSAAEAAAPAPALDTDAAGPIIELPDEAFAAPPVRDPIPTRKLLEVTHFHLFTMPVYLLILAHLFMLSRTHTRVKVGFIGAGSCGVLLHILAPWVARSAPAGATVFYGASGTLLLASMLVMSVVPMVEMWAAPPRP